MNISPNSISESLEPFGLAAGSVSPLKEARQAFERTYILAVLARHQWRIAESARALGLQRPNLYRKARQLRIALRAPEQQ